jgi:hypothetical protein
MYTAKDYETISVPKHFIPKGAKLIEAYKTPTELVIMGNPDWLPNIEHNCDEMGCGSMGHVILRYKLDRSK